VRGKSHVKVERMTNVKDDEAMKAVGDRVEHDWRAAVGRRRR